MAACSAGTPAAARASWSVQGHTASLGVIASDEFHVINNCGHDCHMGMQLRCVLAAAHPLLPGTSPGICMLLVR